jgi:hypothetical protein
MVSSKRESTSRATSGILGARSERRQTLFFLRSPSPDIFKSEKSKSAGFETQETELFQSRRQRGGAPIRFHGRHEFIQKIRQR